jgi:hypothetical protein
MFNAGGPIGAPVGQGKKGMISEDGDCLAALPWHDLSASLCPTIAFISTSQSVLNPFLTPVRYRTCDCRSPIMAMRLAVLLCCLMAPAAFAGSDGALVGGPSWLAWGLGLMCGIALMVLTTLDWRRLPELTRLWLKAQRRNAGWATLGVASLAVLAFY